MIRKYLMERWFGIRKINVSSPYIRRKLAVLYFFMAWNCFGFTIYYILKDKMPTDPDERRQALLTLTGTSSNMYVYQMEGLSIKREFNVTREEMKEPEEEDE